MELNRIWPPDVYKLRDGTPPVSTAVQIVRLGLPTALVEIEVYAEID
jgi:enamine deaminase RidA (YjgF/YER057c/UK114 family)